MSIFARAKAAMYSNKSASQESREGPPWVIIAFTVKLILGLIASQVSAIAMKHSAYHLWSEVVELLTMACLAFIMVNVGFEFTLDKSNMRQYGKDFVIAMAAAGIPAAFVALWFIYALPDPLPWTLAFLSGLFAAPTSAGILFSMLEAAGLKETWLFRKARVLAVFDDLGTLLLLVPLKILVSGFHWELMIEVGLVFLMLGIAYWKLHALRLPSSWRWTALYAVLVTAVCKLVRYVTEEHIAMEAIEMEVLLPAFTLGCITHVCHDAEDVEHGGDPEAAAAAEAETAHEERVKTGVSMVFMLLVGLSMPCLFGSNHRNTPSGHHPDHEHSHAHEAGQLGPGSLIFHVFVVTLLMIAGKMLPMACYKKEVNLRMRFALCLGMCPRGEVGAGIIVISLNLGMQGTSVTIAVLSLAVNLMLSSVFIMMVKRLLRDAPANAPKLPPVLEGQVASARMQGCGEDLSEEPVSDSPVDCSASDSNSATAGVGATSNETIDAKKVEVEICPVAPTGNGYPTLLSGRGVPLDSKVSI